MIGIKSGMVMQRNANDVCEIHVSGVQEITSATYAGQENGNITVTREQDGFLLTDIPVGGPYTVTVNNELFSDIYVGDCWVLAGQSNMEGVGWLTAEDRQFPGDPEIRAFGMDDIWVVARHRLHRAWLAVDRVHTEVLKAEPGPQPERRGVGPGLAFAQEMKRVTGVPQGLLCCAHGGTTLEQWNPKLLNEGTSKSIFAAALRRFRANGSHIKGIFWYQGCSEAMARQSAVFFERTIELFEAFRSFMGFVPIVQVQIGNTALPNYAVFEEDWMKIRAAQLAMTDTVELLDTVSAVGSDNDDLIHLTSQAQAQLGRTAAESMCALLFENGFLKTPTIKKIHFYPEWLDQFYTIEAEYENIYGDLRSSGSPIGFSCSMAPDHITHAAICHVELQGNQVLLRTYAPHSPKGWFVFYGFGCNPYCNITDGHFRRLPAIGPIKIE